MSLVTFDPDKSHNDCHRRHHDATITGPHAHPTGM